jgi:CRP/FNR family cyclic AMP-dependent transcriptional regulator
MQSTLTYQDEEWDNRLDRLKKSEDDILEILSGVKIFESLTSEELRMVERIVHCREFFPQEVVVRQGAPGVGMYIIQSGSTDVVLEVGKDEVIRLANLTDGQFFGEMSLLDGAPRAASVISTERSQIIGFFSSDLMDLIQRSPKLGFKIVLRISQLMGNRLRETVKDYRSALKELRQLTDN